MAVLCHQAVAAGRSGSARLSVGRRWIVSHSRGSFAEHVDRRGPLPTYDALVQKGLFSPDERQREAVSLLQKVHDDIGAYVGRIPFPPSTFQWDGSSAVHRQGDSQAGSGIVGWFKSYWSSAVSVRSESLEEHPHHHRHAHKHQRRGAYAQIPRGLYMWGGVGCGKTTLMDLFYECSAAFVKTHRIRIHFNEFMLGVHNRIHRLRKSGFQGDPIPRIVDEMVQGAWLYCFDEMQCTDIGDAMILRRLFEGLFGRGAVVVTTSNRVPTDLYKNGIQREFFVPFIDLLQERCVVHHLASLTDYRLTGTLLTSESDSDAAGDRDVASAGGTATYMFPLSLQTLQRSRDIFQRLTSGEKPEACVLTVKGHTLHVPAAARGVAQFDFRDLCKKALGSIDYLHLASKYHTIVIDNVPRLTMDDRMEIRRLILLIDALYEHRVKAVITADAPIDQLLVLPPQGPGGGQEDESFAFDRTKSRLQEMQTKEYLETQHRTESLVDV